MNDTARFDAGIHLLAVMVLERCREDLGAGEPDACVPLSNIIQQYPVEAENME